MEPDAEERCEKYVTEALLVVPTSAEALQTLASVRISQQRGDDAVAALQRSFGLWRDLELGADGIPTYASRINLSKLLIETEQYETALEVLERLQLEDDQLPDLWYLGGWCLFLLGEVEEEGSRERVELWETAREWLGNCEMVGLVSLSAGGCADGGSCMWRLIGRMRGLRNMRRSCWRGLMRCYRRVWRTRRRTRRRMRSGRMMRMMRWWSNGFDDGLGKVYVDIVSFALVFFNGMGLS